MFMYRQKNNLIDKINQKRNQMFKSAQKYGMESQQTLKSSMELDRLIIEYMQQFQNSK